VAAAISFLLVGAGMHMVQTAGLALATDIAPAKVQAKVVALLSVMFLMGMLLGSIVFGALLTPFSQIKLIQVIQGAAGLTLIINFIAVWKQEPRVPNRNMDRVQEPSFMEAWRELRATGPWGRRLLATGLGTFAFSMQDILLEPYGGQILGLSVGATTLLTALFASGGILGFWRAAKRISGGVDANRIAGFGAMFGTLGFAGVLLAAPLSSAGLFAGGIAVIGFGAGLFGHGTLTSCMQAAPTDKVGLALGSWGAVQATAAGLAIASGGLLRDTLAEFASQGLLGPVLTGPAVGYCAVYLVEIALLFATLVVIGPLVRAPAQENLPLGLSGPQTAT
jgi:BCD family chlorophyll transporter-like MFS transporter